MLVKNFYSEDFVEFIQFQLNLLKHSKAAAAQIDNEVFKRIGFHEHKFFKALHELQLKKVQYILERDLKISYNYAAMYFEGKGECPPHLDRPQCQYTVDVCFNQNTPWPFFVKNSKEETLQFDMQPGDAIILSGTNNLHWREKIQDGNFCDLVFFHYVDLAFEGELK